MHITYFNTIHVKIDFNILIYVSSFIYNSLQNKMAVLRCFAIENIEPETSAEYISDVLYLSGIAVVSRITLQKYNEMSPTMLISVPALRAYIQVHEWLDTEAAYNLITALKVNTYISLIHSRFAFANQWRAIINSYASEITRDVKYKKNTTIFYLVNSDDSFDGDEENYDAISEEGEICTAFSGAFSWLNASFDRPKPLLDYTY